MFEKGTIVTINGTVGVVILAGEDLPDEMDDHTGVWFGQVNNGIPEVWTIPTEYLSAGPKPLIKH